MNEDGLPEPLLNLSNFIFMWASFQFIVTMYIALFVPENSDEHEVDDDKEDEITEITLGQTFSIFKDVMSNKNLQIWFLFKAGCNAT